MVNTRNGGGEDTPSRGRTDVSNAPETTRNNRRSQSHSPRRAAPRKQQRRYRSGSAHSRLTRDQNDVAVSNEPAPTVHDNVITVTAGQPTAVEPEGATAAPTNRPTQTVLPPNPYGSWPPRENPWEIYGIPATRYRQPSPPEASWMTPALSTQVLYTAPTPAPPQPLYSQAGFWPPQPATTAAYQPATTAAYHDPNQGYQATPTPTTYTPPPPPPATPYAQWHEPYTTAATPQQPPASFTAPQYNITVSSAEMNPAPAAAGAPGEHTTHSSNIVTWKSALTHTTMPLSANISAAIKSKIWQHEFIDLNLLVSKQNSSKRLELELDPSGNYITCSAPPENLCL